MSRGDQNSELPREAAVDGEQAVDNRPRRPIRRRATQDERRTRSLGWLILSAVLVVVATIGIAGTRSYQDLRLARSRAAALSEQIVQIEQQLALLQGQEERLRNDPAAVKRAIRSELGMIGKDELLVVLSEANPPRP